MTRAHPLGPIAQWSILTLLALVLLAATLAVGCRPEVVPVPPPVDPAPVPEGACQAAQARLDELGCPEAQTPGGMRFEDACDAAAADGRNWCPVAISKVKRCADVARAAAGEWGCP